MNKLLFFAMMFVLLSCKINHPKTEIAPSSLVAVVDTAVKTNFSVNNNSPEEPEERNDSLILRSIDSLTAKWPDIKAADPENDFQKQYSGQIGGEKAVFNINLRAINIREQKDMDIWATVGDILFEFYVYEGALFGEPAEGGAEMQICPQCQSPKLVFPPKKYYTVRADGALIAFKFLPDSSGIEGFWAGNLHAKNINHFTLNRSTASLRLDYTIFRFHKHQKMKADEVSEVPSTVVLAMDLPDTANKHYKDFLSNQSGSFIDASEKREFETLEEAKNAYKKEFIKWEKQSHIPWSRSMVGGYDNSEIIYNQQNCVVIRQENFSGAIEYYGDMGVSYLNYDVRRKKFIEEADVMIDNWDDDKHMDLLEKMFDMKNSFKGFAFVCTKGVALNVSGNHGWEVESYFVPWHKIMPFLKKSFIKTHRDWIANSGE